MCFEFLFAECFFSCTRQTKSLPSVSSPALGKQVLCSANKVFAKCFFSSTRQRPYLPRAKKILRKQASLPSVLPLPCAFCLPSVFCVAIHSANHHQSLGKQSVSRSAMEPSALNSIRDARSHVRGGIPWAL